MDAWITLLATAAGALLAGLVGWLTLRAQFKYQREQERRKLILGKLEELYECLSQTRVSFTTLVVTLIGNAVANSPIEGKGPSVPLEKMQMLVSFYAPELKDHLREIENRRKEFGKT